MIACPYCNKAKPKLKIILELETYFEGVLIRVPNAEISQCPACGKKSYHAKELKRWRTFKDTDEFGPVVQEAHRIITRTIDNINMPYGCDDTMLMLTGTTFKGFRWHGWDRERQIRVPITNEATNRKAFKATCVLIGLLEEFPIDVFWSISFRVPENDDTKCPYCDAEPELKVIPGLETKFKGIMINVDDTKFWQCPICDRKTCDPLELKRRHNLQEKSQ